MINELKLELQRIDEYWNELYTDQRDDIILNLLDRVTGTVGKEVIFGGLTYTEMPGDIEAYARPEDPELAAIYDKLGELSLKNNKTPISEEPHVVINKTMIDIFNSLSEDDKEIVRYFLQVRDVEHACDKSPVITTLLHNCIVKNFNP